MKLKVITIALLVLTLMPSIAAQLVVPVQAAGSDFITTGRVQMIIVNPKSGKETYVADTGAGTTLHFTAVSGIGVTTYVEISATIFRHYRSVEQKWELRGNPINVWVDGSLEPTDIPANKGPKVLRLIIDVDNFDGNSALLFSIRLLSP